jgi:hypothetical protein
VGRAGDRPELEARIILFFRDGNGDFLAIDTASRRHDLALGRDRYEGRATAIAGHVGSVCTTAISRAYLRAECRRVPRAAVPARWREAITGESVKLNKTETALLEKVRTKGVAIVVYGYRTHRKRGSFGDRQFNAAVALRDAGLVVLARSQTYQECRRTYTDKWTELVLKAPGG